MRNYDLSPLFRSSVGFDRLNQIFDDASSINESALSYPPYNIARLGGDRYEIVMAVAGFVESDLDVTVTENRLAVSGTHTAEETRDDTAYLHRGIATRAFERRFQLADHVKVTDAKLDNGLLTIDLAVQIPESKKPKQITIGGKSGVSSRVIEGQAA